MDFPQGKFDYKTLTMINFLESIHKIINVKIHLHYSHLTGKIYSYAHDFCNMKVRENQNQFSCIAHNFFRFDRFFLIKRIRLSVWGRNDVSIGGTGLTKINFASIGSQVKSIDTMKYFLTSLRQLVEKLTLQFLNQHSYFLRTWRNLNESQKRKVLDIIVSGKSIIRHEKIYSIDSLNIKPENGISFSKNEFYSTLEEKAMSDDEYNNFKILYTLLKMRHFSDLNDLYNAQDVILLLEVVENRFQAVYHKTMYNPRKVYST